jgi:hypothetical protein
LTKEFLLILNKAEKAGSFLKDPLNRL